MVSVFVDQLHSSEVVHGIRRRGLYEVIWEEMVSFHQLPRALSLLL